MSPVLYLLSRDVQPYPAAQQRILHAHDTPQQACSILELLCRRPSRPPMATQDEEKKSIVVMCVCMLSCEGAQGGAEAKGRGRHLARAAVLEAAAHAAVVGAQLEAQRPGVDLLADLQLVRELAAQRDHQL